jgi:hypothetical protein
MTCHCVSLEALSPALQSRVMPFEDTRSIDAAEMPSMDRMIDADSLHDSAA